MYRYLWYLGAISITRAQQTIPNLQPNLGSGGIDTEKCTCVPYYLCKNFNTTNYGGDGIIDIRKNDGPCKNYLLSCCKAEDTIADHLAALPQIQPRRGCGFRRPAGVAGFRITAGAGDKTANGESQFGEFPWMTAVLSDGHYKCGASLIHPSVVITAAHCVTNREKTFSIRAGEWDTRHVLEPYPHQDRQVRSVEIHPDYYSGGLFNDVALLVLTDAVNVTENVDVICLPAASVGHSGRCYANGWGEAEAFEKLRVNILKKIEAPLVDRDECQEKLRSTRLGADFELHASFLCAGGKPGKDTCMGDGGGPLVCPIEGYTDRYVQAGIVSWGIGCGSGVPGIYANVVELADWIDGRMKAHNFDTSGYRV